MELFASWGTPQAALLITGRNLKAREITDELGIAPTFSREPTAGSSFRPGEGCWAIQVTGEPHQGFDGVIDELIDLISPSLKEIQDVRHRGHIVRLDLSGHVQRGSRTFLSPHALARAAQLELPVSLTTDADPPTRSEELLDWLPAPDGSHREQPRGQERDRGAQAVRPAGFFPELAPGWGLPLDGPMRDSVKATGEPDEAEIIAYLRNGAGIWSEMSAGPDVLDPEAPDLSGIGSLYTDGTWLWRQDLPYYLGRYHVSLPPDFVTHIRNAHHRVPEVPEKRLLEILTRDLGIDMD
ncbi:MULTISPECIES: DUF4279 domain-containing protein [unclassified Streptomyces]|uniref:DUF4279 domain-containing protein n=1 Tax=unclassified Streptomyces TaxID=2593676 RepID=UPI0022586ACA|nr:MULTISPECIES: DUF4279 domain-containing protein [unclassified Streptomyces]MCX4989221.1 DUF4279 domain-containing protein [Streptomyces sp. NBC_00568]MCX5005558.1 DUF4279 domain-containing protein [Streptomyces sp. NBC_00638]